MMDKERYATNFKACSRGRSRDRPLGAFSASGLLIVTARHLTPTAVGRYEIWGGTGAVPHYPLVEIRELETRHDSLALSLDVDSDR